MKKILLSLALLYSALSFGATLVPIQLLNPTGSTSGQSIVSTGASTAPAWGNPTASYAAQAANTALANVTGSTANPTAVALPSCSTTNSALKYTSASGFSCGTTFATTGANTFTASQTISASNPIFISNDTSGTGFAKYVFYNNGVSEWALGNVSTTNLFRLDRYVSNAYVDSPITVANATGIVTMLDGITGSPISGSTGSFTTLAASSTVSGTGFSTYLASPPAIGGTAAAAGSFTTLAASGLISPTSTVGIKGTTTSDSPAAGSVGEYVSSTVLVGSAVSLTANTPANVTSISLTAGDWLVWGNVCTNPAGTTAQSNLQAGISTTSATFATAPNGGAFILAPFTNAANGSPNCLPVGQLRAKLAGTTTYYLVIQSNFTTSTNGGYGFIGATRLR